LFTSVVLITIDVTEENVAEVPVLKKVAVGPKPVTPPYFHLNEFAPSLP
jgi:hypothetical protein